MGKIQDALGKSARRALYISTMMPLVYECQTMRTRANLIYENTESLFMFTRVARRFISFVCFQVSIAERISSIFSLHRIRMNSVTADLPVHTAHTQTTEPTSSVWACGIFAIPWNKDILSTGHRPQCVYRDLEGMWICPRFSRCFFTSCISRKEPLNRMMRWDERSASVVDPASSINV